jgi:sugar (glycoside-pentoside-hexuronide) transporter
MNITEVANNVNVIEDEDRKLKFREKLACGIGGGPSVFHSQMMQVFLLYYYTEVMKINASYVAGLFLISRIIGAILATVFGVFVDKITTPWGKYKPWFLILGIPFAVFGWLTFTDFNLSSGVKLIYATVTYTVYNILASIGQGPGSAVTPAITKRIDERVSIGQIGMFCAMIGAMLVSVTVQPLYKRLGSGNDAKGFSLLMAGIAVITILIAIYQVVTLKERYILVRKNGEKKTTFKRMFFVVFTNKTAVIAYVNAFATSLAYGIRSAIMLHYFKYYFHNEGLMVTSGLVSLFPNLIGVALSSKATKLMGIKTNLIVSVIINIATMAAVIVIPPTSTGAILFLALTTISGLFIGMATPAQGTMMPAAMDYTEWKTGMNINAFMGSIGGFLSTFGTALSGAIAAGSLSLVGYVPGMEQSGSTILGLKVLMSILPAFIIAFTISVLWFDLSEEKQAQITRELAERRKNTKVSIYSFD